MLLALWAYVAIGTVVFIVAKTLVQMVEEAYLGEVPTPADAVLYIASVAAIVASAAVVGDVLAMRVWELVSR